MGKRQVFSIPMGPLKGSSGNTCSVQGIILDMRWEAFSLTDLHIKPGLNLMNVGLVVLPYHLRRSRMR